MDNEKQIEEMTDLLVNQGVFNNLVCRQDYAYPDAVINENCRQIAEILVNAGYGNVKQAVKKFANYIDDELTAMWAEHFKTQNLSQGGVPYTNGINACLNKFRMLVKELYGNE